MCVCVSPWQHLNGISECPMVRPSRNAAPTPGFATSVWSAVGGSARLNLAPGSGRCLPSPLPPVAERPSNKTSFIVLGRFDGRTSVCVPEDHSLVSQLLWSLARTLKENHNQTVLLPQLQLDLYPPCCELLEPHETLSFCYGCLISQRSEI